MNTAAAIARDAYRARQAHARRKVQAGDWTEQQAQEKLRPWLAIASLAKADLPELFDHTRDPLSQSLSKAPMLRANALATLAQARDAAIDAADGQATGRAADEARNLSALASALGAPPYNYTARPELVEGEAA